MKIRNTGIQKLLLSNNQDSELPIGHLFNLLIIKAGWIAIIFFAIIYAISPKFSKSSVFFFIWLLCSILYQICLEIISKSHKDFYERHLFKVIRVIVSFALVLFLYFLTGGLEGVFWFCFLWPLLTAALYFDWIYTIIVYSLVFLSIVSSAFSLHRASFQSNLGVIFIYLSLLLIFTALWKNLVETIKLFKKNNVELKEERLVEKFDDIWKSLYTSKNLSEILRTTLEQIAESANDFLNADLVNLYQYDPITECFTLPPITTGNPQDYVNISMAIQSDDVVLRVFQNGDSIFASDALRDPILSAAWELPRNGLPEDRYVIREGIKSTIALPLQADGCKEGVLFISYRRRMDFKNNSEIRRIANEFALSAARLIKSARLIKDRRLTLENKMQALNTYKSINNLRSVTDIILDNVKTIVPYDKATIQIITSGENRELFSYKGFSEKNINAYLLRPISADNLLKHILDVGEPITIPDTSINPFWEKTNETMDVKSWIGFPLFDEHDIIGLLTFDHNEVGFFNRSHLNLIEPFSIQISMLIKEFLHSNKYMETITEDNKLQLIGENISEASLSDAKHIAEIVFLQASQVLDTKNFYIALFYPVQTKVEFLLAYEKGESIVVGEGIWAERINGNGLTEFALKSSTYTYIPREVLKFLQEHNINTYGVVPKSWLGMPLLSKKTPIGIIGVQDYENENAFNENSIRKLQFIATHSAIAISNSIAVDTRIEERINQSENNLLNAISIIFSDFTKEKLLLHATEFFTRNFHISSAIYIPDSQNEKFLNLEMCSPTELSSMVLFQTTNQASPLKPEGKILSNQLEFFDVRYRNTRLEAKVLLIYSADNTKLSINNKNFLLKYLDFLGTRLSDIKCLSDIGIRS